MTDGPEGMNLDPSGASGLGGLNSDMSSAGQSNGLLGSLMNGTGTEQILVIGFVCVLAIKYIFFENKDVHNLDMTRTNVQYSRTFSTDNSAEQLAEVKDLMSKDDNDSTSGVSESFSQTTSSTPSSTRPTTPTASLTTNDELDATPRMVKPATPSILITTQSDSDTESVMAEYRKISESESKLSLMQLVFFALSNETLFMQCCFLRLTLQQLRAVLGQ